MNIIIKVFLTLSLMISVSMANWEMEMVDEPSFFWEASNSVVDKNNKSHVVFGGDHLYHAWFDGTTWENEIVDSTSKVGSFSSLAVDNNNTLHISYYDSLNGTINYATNKDNTWTIEAVETPTQITITTSIVVDSNNNPYILYKDDLDKSFKLATKTDGLWIIETLQNIDYYSIYVSITSMAVDSLSNIHISYMEGMYTNDQKLMYMSNKTGNWEVTEIGSTTSYASSLFIDKNDNIHLAYYSSSRDSSNLIVNNITYTTDSSGVWTKETIDTEYNYYISLKVDTLGYAHISKTLSSGGISYITNKSGEWIKSNVPTHDGYAGKSLSLALDTDGNSYITQIDGVGIKSTTNASGQWVETSVYEPTTISGNVKMLIDSKGVEHIIYSYNSPYYNKNDNKSIVHSYNDPYNGWIIEVINKSISPYVALASAVLDVNDSLHISYATYPDTLSYATNKSGSWKFETVSTNGVTTYFSGEIDIDFFGHAHMSYNSNGQIFYATNKSGSWISEPVSQNIRSRYNSSITVDNMNNIHISYYGDTNLEYVTNKSGAWVEETVDINGWNGYGSSIRVSADGTVYISYSYDDYYENNDTYLGGLRLATRSADVWNIENIYTSDLGWPDTTSLTFDSKGSIHISFLEIGTYDLMYATNNQGSWNVERIDWDGYFGSNNSIALGADDSVHIAYIDGDNSDLKYAYKASGTTSTVGKYPGYSANGLICRKGSDGATIIYDEDGKKTVIPAKNKEKVKGKKDIVHGKPELLFYNPQTGTCESRENIWKNEFKVAQ